MLPNVVLFQGVDATGRKGLWETVGLAGGTFELVAGGSASGLSPSNLTAFNGQVLFEGNNAISGNAGLWVTNGTAAGTMELSVSGAPATGLNPNSMTVFNGQVFFNGTDTSNSNFRGLWVTNGTGSGTHEVTGIAGTDPSTGLGSVGLDPSNFTVFAGKMLFNGASSANVAGPAGHVGLWTTDGTAVGTHELTGIAGASTTGLGLDPGGLTVFGSEVLFSGADTSGVIGLWETDGTAGGTHEITVVGATGTGLSPKEMTVLGGKVLFNGESGANAAGPNGHHGLWVTNGTTGGTTELTGIVGAGPGDSAR